jgi:uncharacterized protein
MTSTIRSKNFIANLLSLVIAAGLSVSSIASAQTSTVEPAEFKQLDAAKNYGPLYTFSKNGKTHYLLGTIHVGRPNYYPMDWGVTLGVMSTDVVALELDVTEAGFVDRYTAIATESAKKQWPLVSAQARASVDQIKQKLTGMQIDENQMPPWALPLSVAMAQYVSLGLSPGASVESYLTGFAGAVKKPIVALESLNEQIQGFTQMPAPLMNEWLTLTAQEMDKADAIEEHKSLSAAWEAADIDALHAVVNKNKDLKASESYLKEELITKRNLVMLKKIDALSADKTLFVAVGCLHLSGPNGLVKQLSAMGYDVKPAIRGAQAKSAFLAKKR